jgi:hypothetical protein
MYSGHRKQPCTDKLKYLERFYQVNEYGDVRIVSIDNMTILRPKAKRGKIPYPKVSVNVEARVTKTLRDLHRLVMLAFDPSGFHKGLHIRHLSGPNINDINNLAWGSPGQNADDKNRPHQNNPLPNIEEYRHVHSQEYDCSAIGLFVSNHGNVKQVTVTIPTAQEYYYKKNGAKKHKSISCRNIGSSESVYILVHRAVYQEFVGEVPNGLEVCHNDGDPFNNDVRNLRADTSENNSRDRELHGTMIYGNRHGNSKISEDQTIEIRLRRFNGERLKCLAAEFKISQSTVSAICTRNNYRRDRSLKI